MTIPITINLPETLVASVQRLGEATAREVSDVLLETLEIVLPTFRALKLNNSLAVTVRRNWVKAGWHPPN